MENLGKLLYRHFVLNRNKFMLYVLATGLTFFALFFVQAWLNKSVEFHSMLGWYMPVFFIIGFVHSAHAFGDLSVPAKSYQYLLLPASNLEKFIAVWLSTSVFYVIAGYLVFMVSAGFGGGLAAFTFGFPVNYDSLGYFGHVRTIGSFLVLQTLFLFGSLTFKNGAFIKTVLSVVVFVISLFIVNLIIARIVLGTFSLDMRSIFEGNNAPMFELSELFGNYIPIVLKTLYWGIVGPFFLVVSYFKLKESEV